MNKPGISVITVNLNNYEGLKKTIGSVVAQTYPAIEFIVIDGGSKDGSVALLDHSKINYFVSEKDNGIYHAMNKGIAVASGNYCLFLNSGDCLVEADTIANAVSLFNEHHPADIYFGDLVIDGCLLGSPDQISLEFLLNRSVPHPASLIRRSLFDAGELGNYLEDYTMVSDWVFFLSAYLKQYSYVHIDMAVTVFDSGGISSKNQDLNTAERGRALRSVFPNLQADVAYFQQLKKYRSSRIYKYADAFHAFLRKLGR